MKVSLLDYGAGNVRSVRNAIASVGFEIVDVTDPSGIDEAEVIVFPGVGAFGTAMEVLHEKGYAEPLRRYLGNDRPYLGICLGMQTLFESSEEGASENENGGHVVKGLGVVPGTVVRFDNARASVPHIGWNGRAAHKRSVLLSDDDDDAAAPTYFVHSYHAPITDANADWVLTSTTHGGTRFVSSVQKGNVVAAQFHPEKSGGVGLAFLRRFLENARDGTLNDLRDEPIVVDSDVAVTTTLVKRVVVALDVRTNDDGDLVVTKGDQYDVREKAPNKDGKGRSVRNLGKPVSLARRYYDEGADEICFLNITSFRQGVLEDAPMLGVLEEASRNIFVPLTVGGGIRDYTDPGSNNAYSALEVAARYFRAGADKVSIGSDAVYAAEDYVRSGGERTGTTSIETISRVYGVQAVVVSIDPKRVYVGDDNDDHAHKDKVVVKTPDGRSCWYRCTVKGGREERDLCAVTAARACEALGAGELMVNCIDADGTGNGYAHDLLRAVRNAVSVPVIASSGAGRASHFVDAFRETPGLEAALAAGMFHRREVGIDEVKRALVDDGVPARATM